MGSTKVRVLAYYLPQFHPIKENDEWWGKGFTEWTNVGRAKPLFKNHYQPRIPADLGYYDLRLSEVREQQAELACYAGIEGFAYWHYWFAGKRLIEKPFNDVVKSGKPDFPFCLAWANDTWSGIWNNDPKRILLEQTYPGEKDYTDHFYSNLESFNDQRYIKIDDKLVFTIYKPFNLPEPNKFIELWNNLAIRNGLKGFYFIGISNDIATELDAILKMGFNAVNSFNLKSATNSISKVGGLYKGISRRFFDGKLKLSKFEYKDVIKNMIIDIDLREDVISTLLPNWDVSPRSGKRALILHNSTPEYFDTHIKKVLTKIKEKQNKVLFLKSWNEWAEGNYVEPDMKYGLQYINILRKYLKTDNV